MANFLAFDVESGGIDKSTTSLLTVCFIVADEHYKAIDELNLTLKPNDGIYKITMSAMDVNKIDLVEHDKKAVTYSEGGRILRDFLVKHSTAGSNKLIPLGKNVKFDQDFVTEHLLSRTVWNQYVSYRFYDLTSVILFAKRIGVLPQSAPEGLSSLAEHLGVNFSTRAHEARSDTIMTMELMKRLEETARY